MYICFLKIYIFQRNQVLTETEATGLSVEGRKLELTCPGEGKKELKYDRLILATGSSPR